MEKTLDLKLWHFCYVAGLIAILGSGCQPYPFPFTFGRQAMSKGGWPSELQVGTRVGLRAPIPIRIWEMNPNAAPEGGTASLLEAFDIRKNQKGSAKQPSDDWNVVYADLSWSIMFEDDAGLDSEINEYSLGVGFGRVYNYPSIETSHDRAFGSRSEAYAASSYWGVSAGLSLIEARLKNSGATPFSDRDTTVGLYIDLAAYQSAAGGVIVHALVAPDVGLGGIDRDLSSVSISYWTGWGPVYVVGVLVYILGAVGAR